MANFHDKQTYYCFTANKRMMEWSIWIEKSSRGYIIHTEHGIKGKTITQDKGLLISEGKASRSLEEQVELQYNSIVKKKIDKGYTTNASGINKSLPVKPMLAQNYEKHKKKIKFPAIAQPKLDGVRCLIRVQDGEVRLLSRLGKPFSYMDHIREAVLAIKLPQDIVLDGELFSETLHFQTVVGLVKRKKNNDEDRNLLKKIKFNAFDLMHLSTPDMPFIDRWNLLDKLVKKDKQGVLKIVPIYPLKSDTDVQTMLSQFLQNGDEGIMIRNEQSVYEHKRSYHLQKYKKFFDAEYEIVGAEQGQGNAIGTVIWICKNSEGREFKVRPKGTRAERTKMYKDRASYVGKYLTVKYQELTPDKIPRFPVGIAVRDYE